MRSYEGWTLVALKTELKKRGAKVSGRKEELIDRLEAYDRNENFGNVPEPSCSTWKMIVPDAASYKDITTNSIIPLTNEATDIYLNLHEALLGEKSRKLYEERFIRFAKSCVEDNHVFVKLQCRAQMKRTVTYDIDIKLDMEGGIDACQCDCTAGMGPGAHCKHVRTALYGLLQFAVNKTLIVELTCTDTLQTFHRPKSGKTTHSTSPVKSQDLGLLQDLSHVLFNPMEDLTDESDSAFNSRFRSVLINDTVNRKEQAPIMHLFGPANPYALDLDHDYLAKRQSDIFLDRENITSVNMDIIRDVEKSTRGQSTNPRWKMERQKRIQSSNFGKVAKATEKRDMNKMAKDFMCLKDISHIPAISHGIKHEDAAIKQYEEKTSNKVARKGLIIDQVRPYLGTSVDGMSGDIVIEVKCPFASKGKTIDHTTVPYLMQTTGGLKLYDKHDYFYQIQGQLHITGKKLCHLVIYTLSDLKIIDVPRNDVFIAEMLKKLDDFFISHHKPIYLSKHFYRNYSDFIWN